MNANPIHSWKYPVLCQNHRMSTWRRSKGVSHRFSAAFTMLEIMISITILGIIITAIYSSWSAILRSSKVGLETAANVQRSRIAARCLTDSLLSLQMFGANLPYYSFEADTSSDFASLSFVARLPMSFPHSGIFGDQVLRRVTFMVEGNNLVMYQFPVLAEENADQKPVSIVLATNVTLFQLEFFGTRTNDWADKWTYTNQLPKLVKFTIAQARSGRYGREPEDVISRVVSLNAMIVPRDVQMATGQPGQPGQPVPPGMPGQPPIGTPTGRGGVDLNPGTGSRSTMERGTGTRSKGGYRIGR